MSQTRTFFATTLAAILLVPVAARAQNDMADIQVQMAEARRHFDEIGRAHV